MQIPVMPVFVEGGLFFTIPILMVSLYKRLAIISSPIQTRLVMKFLHGFWGPPEVLIESFLVAGNQKLDPGQGFCRGKHWRNIPGNFLFNHRHSMYVQYVFDVHLPKKNAKCCR